MNATTRIAQIIHPRNPTGGWHAGNSVLLTTENMAFHAQGIQTVFIEFTGNSTYITDIALNLHTSSDPCTCNGKDCDESVDCKCSEPCVNACNCGGPSCCGTNTCACIFDASIPFCENLRVLEGDINNDGFVNMSDLNILLREDLDLDIVLNDFGEMEWPYAGNPIITSIFTADPSAHVWPSHPDRLFLYPSQDMFPVAGCDRMDRYHVFSTDNMFEWVNHGEIVQRRDLHTGANAEVWGGMENLYENAYFMWAPDAAYREQRFEGDTGPYFFIFPVSLGCCCGEHGPPNGYSWHLGIAHSDRPEGGFRDNPISMLKDHNGNPIRGDGTSYGWHLIDPSIYWHPEEKVNYLAVGGGGLMRIARLSDCMTRLAEPFTVFGDINAGRTYNTLGPADRPREEIRPVPRYMHEGPWIFSRVNDFGQRIYYVMSAGSITPNGDDLIYSYSTEGFFGPWTFGGSILEAGVTNWTSHGSVVEFKENWYLFYHTNVLSGGADSNRSASVDRLFFRPDGTIYPVWRTHTSVPAVGPPTDREALNQRFTTPWKIETPFRYVFEEEDTEGFGPGTYYSVGDAYINNGRLSEHAQHGWMVTHLEMAARAAMRWRRRSSSRKSRERAPPRR
jgi:hypothetical protein